MPGNFEYLPNEPRTIALTPDGQTVVLRASVNGQCQLFVRAMNTVDVSPIAGTEGADMYFAVSPDGKSVAFSTLNDRLIKKVSLSGGIPTPLGPTFGRFGYVTSRAHSYTPVR